MHYVYILRCAGGGLYVGVTRDLDERMYYHRLGKGGAFTAARLPVELAYSEAHDTEQAAVARERQLKRWTRRKKEALIAGNTALLKKL